MLRLDWISLRCRRHGGLEPVTLEISSPKDFAALKFRGCHLIGDRLVMVPGTSPRIEVEVERRAGAPVYSLDFECAFAVLPLARSQARERWGRTKAALRRIGKESTTGRPTAPGSACAAPPGRLRRPYSGRWETSVPAIAATAAIRPIPTARTTSVPRPRRARPQERSRREAVEE